MSSILNHIIAQLKSLYPAGEARAVARMLLEEGQLNLTTSQIFAGSLEDLSPQQAQQLDAYLQQLLAGVPLQYVLGSAQFCGLPLQVGPGVLIPRPETEDLVNWVTTDWQQHPDVQILDACTGSGCIAVALADRLPQAMVTAVDLSDDALRYATCNAEAYGGRVQVLQRDVLAPSAAAQPQWHVLVSNPPYIAQQEYADMAIQVRDHEPSMALFVPDQQPLLFYEALAKMGQQELLPGGAIYVEINQRFGQEVCQLFHDYGYRQVQLRHDRFDNPRMVKGVKA